jgi:uroporphyrinogen decarboxylase
MVICRLLPEETVQSPFKTPFKPDYESLLSCMRREGTPNRVHNMELFLDGEVQIAIGERFDLWKDIKPDEPFAYLKKTIALHRFLGYDYVTCGVGNVNYPTHQVVAEDTADLKRATGRSFVDQHQGPIASWEDFEKYPWPDLDKADTRDLEWLQNNLPDDMCIIGGLWSHFAELLNWLMGYETLCYALHDDRALVGAVRDKIADANRKMAKLLLQFDRVEILWGSDDMGFRTGTLISPDDMREFVLPGHKEAAEASHKAGRLYQLHSCGQLAAIMPNLIDDVKIDAKHSFEDAILSVIDHKRIYGDRITLIGGVDVDLIARFDETRVRARAQEILRACMPGGGYVLGTGNSVANYIPVDNYLAMLDEGRCWVG